MGNGHVQLTAIPHTVPSLLLLLPVPSSIQCFSCHRTFISMPSTPMPLLPCMLKFCNSRLHPNSLETTHYFAVTQCSGGYILAIAWQSALVQCISALHHSPTCATNRGFNDWSSWTFRYGTFGEQVMNAMEVNAWLKYTLICTMLMQTQQKCTGDLKVVSTHSDCLSIWRSTS